MRFLLALLLLTFVLPAADPAWSQSREVDLHKGIAGQNRVGRLFWRGGVELNFRNSRFGGVSAMQVELGGRTAYLITDRGDLAEVTLEYDRSGNLSAAELAELRSVIGAGGRGTDAAMEAIARMPDGGWLVAFERNHRLMHFRRSKAPLQTVPRLLTTPVGLERASPRRGIEAAAATDDRKVLLIGEDIPTAPGFSQAWLGDGSTWTPMTYAMFKPYRPVGATMLPNGNILVIERRGSVNRPTGTRFALINKRLLRPGAPIQTSEVARLEPPFVTANFEAIATAQGLQGQTLLYVASDNEFSPGRPTLLLMFELLP
ncbi:MAG: esterase-like activity of phytase family protein [Alphaproteobacteria bacterium]|nr:esterase-like activity of phytase family protein [Alphaproteobacteria bacterium]